ncbi:hypothetical protein [Bacillus mycoides]|uniref:hypothetical protein n=1 Tax=Bacillus mycoides TaxID=1405 RepID=UPI0002798505|nr:hypothetical protein [Bacillus mycoides]EJS00695.1 hypothetical protein IKO_04480 [Bacillus cereus VDM034]EJS16398.1 hypothetical protein IKS_00533 [Bacillus cereus VDM062]MBG9687101.1 hypothetical protein [Bacillus mycoides]QWI24607.1 hypothetical protein EXW34_25985 [Bacillus mycoides]
MNRNKIIKYICAIISVTVYLIFIPFINFDSLEDGYRITVLLPLVFLLCFYLFLWEPLIKKRTPFIVLFSGVAFIRYVVLSIVTILNGTYWGLSKVPPSSESLNLAGILMCWELLITSILIFYWSKKTIPDNYKKQKKVLESQANPLIYLIFALVSVILIVLFPQARQGLSFFGEINRALNDEIGSPIILGIRECLINAKYFILFAFVIFLQKKFKGGFSKNSLFSYLFILVISMVVIGIRIGTNRKKLLADTFAILLFLWNLFPKYKRTTIFAITSIGVMLVVITTVSRGLHDSVNGFFVEYFDLDFLQTYFLGQYNVAIAIEAVNYFPSALDIKTYLFGFLRPLFGIGAVVKNIDFSTVADLFDTRMSMGLNGWRGDQILPMIGEGYMLFGLILAPIISVMTVRLGIFFDSLYSKSKKIEIVFIASIVSFYLAQGMILNSTIILNMLSFRLAIYMPVVYIAYASIKKYNSKGYHK